MTVRRATVFGGSGFVGRYIVKRLAAKGIVVRVAVRDPEGALFLKPNGAVGQIAPVYADVGERHSVEAAVDGVDLAINCVSLYQERGKATFERVHVEGARNVAEASKAAGLERLIHISGIGSRSDHRSKYARARAAGDEAVKAAFPDATFLSPSVMFGPEDSFFNALAAPARLSPALPLFGGGKTRIQPVYVGDVADAVMAALRDGEMAGRTLQLGGPHIYTFRELIELMLEEINRKRLLVPVPFGLAEIGAAMMGLLPNPPFTRDQIRLLQEDNLVEGTDGLETLGIRPTAVEVILPTYLHRFRKGGPPRRRHDGGMRPA